MDFRVGRNDEEFAPWSVLSDISITMVLFLVIFIVIQFLQTYQERAVQSALRSHQEVVAKAVAAVAAGDATVTTLSPERQRITFRDATLFEICKANLKPDGEALLRRVGSALGQSRDLLETVSVERHTDTLTIVGRAGCPYRSNWELSSARATSVVSLWSQTRLIENATMSAIGRSEYHPVDPGNLNANRRIEVILQYSRSAAQRKVRGGNQ